MTDEPHRELPDTADDADTADDERGSEVDDYTGEVPRVDVPDDLSGLDAAGLSGFGDGDVADVDDGDRPDRRAVGDAPDGDGDADTIETDDAETHDAETDDAEREGNTLQADFDELQAQVAQLQDLVMRQQADFENFRKRTATQSAAEIERATGRLVEAFLPVLDAAEAAYVQHPDEVGPLLNAMLAELKKHGLEALDLADRPFDPEVAEAVAHEPGDGGEVVVAEVLRSGYRWKGKTLRPAMVRTTD